MENINSHDGDGTLDAAVTNSAADHHPGLAYTFGGHTYSGTPTVDVDGDGTPDGIRIDFDGSGQLDAVAWDSDGDGTVDTILMSSHHDGHYDTAYHDPQGNGHWNGAEPVHDGDVAAAGQHAAAPAAAGHPAAAGRPAAAGHSAGLADPSPADSDTVPASDPRSDPSPDASTDPSADSPHPHIDPTAHDHLDPADPSSGGTAVGYQVGSDSDPYAHEADAQGGDFMHDWHY